MRLWPDFADIGERIASIEPIPFLGSTIRCLITVVAVALGVSAYVLIHSSDSYTAKERAALRSQWTRLAALARHETEAWDRTRKVEAASNELQGWTHARADWGGPLGEIFALGTNGMTLTRISIQSRMDMLGWDSVGGRTGIVVATRTYNALIQSKVLADESGTQVLDYVQRLGSSPFMSAAVTSVVLQGITRLSLAEDAENVSVAGVAAVGAPRPMM